MVKSSVFTTVLLFIVVLSGYAGINPKPANPKNDSIYLPEFKFESNLDSLYNLWIMQNANSYGETATEEDILTEPDSGFVYSSIPIQFI
jgi:hypothetical protein